MFRVQISPLIAPTVDLMRDESRKNVLFPGSNLVVLVLLWLPFLLVFMLDCQIYYALWTAVHAHSAFLFPLGSGFSLDVRTYYVMKSPMFL